MVSRILKSPQSGISFIELIIGVTVAFVLISVTLNFSQTDEQKKLSRDQKRISDLALLETAIVEYAKINDYYPDLENTVRTSNVLPSGGTDLANSRGYGWIAVNMEDQLTKLPLDPINEDNFVYNYSHTQTSYELNAVLEHLLEQSVNDGGDNDNIYEIGTQLDIL